MLNLARIRAHCGLTNTALDPLLEMYLAAALAAAEQYTGRKLKPGLATDTFANPRGSVFELSGHPSQPYAMATLYARGHARAIPCTVAGRLASIGAVLDHGWDALSIQYRIGPLPDDDAPPSDVLVDADPLVEHGVLKFIAYALAHRGDDPNCWATDSGAIGAWSAHKPVNFG